MFYVMYQELVSMCIADTEKCKMSAEQFNTSISFVKDLFLTTQCSTVAMTVSNTGQPTELFKSFTVLSV